MIEYYNRDCIEAMKEYPDNHFDLAIVDPPYGVGTVTYMPCQRRNSVGGFIDTYSVVIATLNMNQRPKMKTQVAHKKCAKTTNLKFGDENVAPPPHYFQELFRVSKNQIIWGGNYFLLPPSRGFIVWEKTTVSENFSMAMAEFAWLSKNENAKIWRGAPQGTAKDPRIHPTQKPVALYKWILEHYANPGDLILDTHVGSASSLIACQELGFDAVEFEIDENYYRASKERLESAQAQRTLESLAREASQSNNGLQREEPALRLKRPGDLGSRSQKS